MRFFRTRKNTEERIREATFYLLAEKGYSELSMRDIAKRAGVVLGQLTYYYKKKENLILSVIDEVFENCIDEVKKKIKEADDKLSSVLDFYGEIFQREPEIPKIVLNFMTESLWDTLFRDRYIKFENNIVCIVENIYKDNGNEEKIAKQKANFFTAALNGLIAQRLLRPDEVRESVNNYRKILLSI